MENTGGASSSTEAPKEHGVEESQEEHCPNIKKTEVKPSEEEVQRHNATHVPYRSWCPYCVAGKAKAPPHNKSQEVLTGQHLVQIDYMFLNDREDKSSKPNLGIIKEDEQTEEQEEVDTMPVLVLRDRETKYMTARVMPRKGPHPHAVRRLGQDLTKILGYNRVFIKSDQEEAIKKLKECVKT